MPNPSHDTRYAVWIALAIAALACGLRSLQIGESLWVDELHTAWVVEGGPGDLVGRAADGNQGPIYYAAQWLVARAAGMSEPSLRGSSLLAGTLLVALTFWIARDFTASVPAALFAVLLAAVDRHLVFYAQEARPYAWVQLLSAIEVWAFYHALQRPTPRRLVTVATLAVILFHTHYTTALLQLSLAVYAIIRPPADPRHRRWLLWTACGIAAGCLPAIPHLFEIAGRRYQWSAMVMAHAPRSLGLALIVYAVVPLVVAVAGRVLRRSRREASAAEIRSALWLVVLWLSVPIAVAAGATYGGIAPMFMSRYLQTVWPAFPIIAALGIALCPRGAPRFVVATVVVAASLATGGMVSQFFTDGRILNDRREDWRAAVEWVNSTGGQQPVVLFPGLVEDRALTQKHDTKLEVYCRFPIDSLYPGAPLSSVRVAMPTTLAVRFDADLRRELQRAELVHVMVRGGPQTAAAIIRSCEKELSQDGRPRRLERREFGAGLWVVRITLH